MALEWIEILEGNKVDLDFVDKLYVLSMGYEKGYGGKLLPEHLVRAWNENKDDFVAKKRRSKEVCTYCEGRGYKLIYSWKHSRDIKTECINGCTVRK